MKRLRTVVFPALALLVAPLAAAAEERSTITADQILHHFGTAAPTGGKAPKAKTRGLCVGNCDAPVAAVAPEPFNLQVTFELASDRLTPEAKHNVAQFAKALRDPTLANRKFYIDGHTDGRGDDESNMELSRRRAAAVKSYLLSLDVDSTRLQERHFGKTQPKTSDPLDSANRRVETSFAD